jgi:glycosyltransferase involved in cell wall biosynthesis
VEGGNRKNTELVTVPKIAIITSQTKSVLTFRVDFLKALRARGCDVVVLGPDDETRPSVESHLVKLGVSFQCIPLTNTGLNPFKDVKAFFNLVSALRQKGFTGVFSYTLKPVIYGSLAAKIAGIPCITSMMTGLGHLYTFHDLKTRLLRFVSDRLLTFAFKANQVVFFQNPDDAAVFLKKKLLLSSKVIRINGSGVNLDYFAQKPLPKRPLTFLFIGRLLISKGFKEFCQAASQVKALYPKVQFQVLGGVHPNPANLSLEEAQELMTSAGIEHLGEVDDVRPFIQSAHVVVLPSYREGTPKALLEALAMGRPLITTDVPGCRETVIDGKNGYLVQSQDVPALTQAFIKMIEHPELLAPMAQESRILAQEKFDVHQVNEILMRYLGVG